MVLEEGSPSNTSILNESLYKIKTHVNVSCMADIHVMQWSETMHIRSQSDLQSGVIEERNKHASRGSHTTLALSIYLGQHKRNGFKKFFTKPTAHRIRRRCRHSFHFDLAFCEVVHGGVSEVPVRAVCLSGTTRAQHTNYSVYRI